MLIFISDIHFVDETAGEHNIPARAFEGVLEDIRRFGAKETDEIKIIFLGDIFDLNRTTYWLDRPEEERPWGAEGSPDIVEGHANIILDTIISKNQDTFNLLSSSLKEPPFSFHAEPERIYIPGNHDRMCGMFDSLRNKVRKALGIQPADNMPFLHAYENADYGVIARHGHEYDVLNYEGTDLYTDDDYAGIPIGDLITSEIASRLPYTIMKNVENMNPPLDDGQNADLRRNLNEIENVRPYSAIFEWLFYQVNENDSLRKVFNESLHQIVDNFNSLKYLDTWYKRHDKWNPFAFDEADKLQEVLRLFRMVSVEAAEELMKIYYRITGSPTGQSMSATEKSLITAASGMLSRLPDRRICIMGHTHNPMQVPIRIAVGGQKEQYYINTGTWRKRYVKGREGGFMGIKNLTYTILYNEKENPKQLFETWTGSLKEMS